MKQSADLLIVGSGPAGSAAAISAAQAGLRVVMVERARMPYPRPGETLHPGIHPILAQLGIAKAVEAASWVRPVAQIIAWGEPARTVPYGEDARGIWRAYQIRRDTFDMLCHERAIAAGVQFLRPVSQVAPFVERGTVVGLNTDHGVLLAPYVIDASGTRGFLRRALYLREVRHSPRLIAFYGYVRGPGETTPRLEGDARGWTWTAQVRDDLAHWCRLNFAWTGVRPTVPAAFADRPTVGKTRATDVTWRHTTDIAGPGYFIAGDAAFVIDPAASHGVLRALMSGIMTAHLAASVLNRGNAAEAARSYKQWTDKWFQADTTHLANLYCALDPEWFPGRSTRIAA